MGKGKLEEEKSRGSQMPRGRELLEKGGNSVFHPAETGTGEGTQT